MSVAQYVITALLLGLTALSLMTLSVLKTASPWTSAGWVFTMLYCASADAENYVHHPLAMHLPYWWLAALIVAFAVAGVRDERQAEPWWSPRTLGRTRAERNANTNL